MPHVPHCFRLALIRMKLPLSKKRLAPNDEYSRRLNYATVEGDSMYTYTFTIFHNLLTNEYLVSRNIRDPKLDGVRSYYASPRGKNVKSTQKIVEVPSDGREIFEKYSSIEPDKVSKHVGQTAGHLPHS